ncbi:MAG: HAD-IA family hydrolase [Proteobacteria bacterium]|nr:HAD-IA family hydrolase [Pseudomonadota bacterium]
MIGALLWDVDGTLAETERDGHRVAFNLAFAAAAVPWRWSEQRYGDLLRVTGGRERLLHDMEVQAEAPRAEAQRRELAARLHALKNEFYAEIVERGELPLRPGVSELLDDCRRAKVPVAIVTTTTRANVVALLRRHLGTDWAWRFAVLVCAEDAPRKKPDPQAYQVALGELALPASACVAIEDSPAGVAAARAAGVAVLLTRSYYFSQTPPDGTLAAGPGLGVTAGWDPPLAAGDSRVNLAQIARWHATLPTAAVA